MTTLRIRAKTERGYRAIGRFFPPVEWTEVDATDDDLAALAFEPAQFLEVQRVDAAPAEEPKKKK